MRKTELKFRLVLAAICFGAGFACSFLAQLSLTAPPSWWAIPLGLLGIGFALVSFGFAIIVLASVFMNLVERWELF